MSAVNPSLSQETGPLPDGLRPSPAGSADYRHWISRWWPLCLGLFAVLAGTSIRFSQNLWQITEFEHCPLLLAVALWVLWQKREAIVAAQAPRSPLGGAVLMVAGVIVYLAGVRLKAGYFEFGSLAVILAGALALVGGWRLVRECAFVLVFLVLASPMPAPIIFYATSGLKEWVSVVAESVLHAAGYPVARDGVTLRMGPYNLLLADACSGMNSLVSLTAVGLLYVYLTARRAAWHTALLVASIIPVAISTNIVRVLILMLITYHLGDAAGQGFLHEFAGFLLFLVAVLILAAIDFLLGRVFRVTAASGMAHGA